MNPSLLLACATCYGQSDSPMAAGMNWGIFSLLGMILFVLGGVGAFFIFLARRSAAMAAETSLASPSASAGSSEPEGDKAEHQPFRHKPVAVRFASVFAWRKKVFARSGSRFARRDGFARTGNHG